MHRSLITYILLACVVVLFAAVPGTMNGQIPPPPPKTPKPAKMRVQRVQRDDDSTKARRSSGKKVHVTISNDGEIIQDTDAEDDAEDIESDGTSNGDFNYNFDVLVPHAFPPEQLQVLRELRTGLENDSPFVEVYRNIFRNYDEARELYGDLNFYRQFDSEEYKQFKEIPKLDKKSFELARRYRETSNAEEKGKIEAELSTTLQKLFDLREQRKELEIKKLQADLQKTQEKFNERKANRNSIIKRRLDLLLNKADMLEW